MKTYLGGGASIVLGVVLLAVILAPSATAGRTKTSEAAHKVTLCHATGSHKNPYVKITVDYHAVTKAGHGEHGGPVWHPGIDERWGDIIPAFDLGGLAVFPGLNWGTEGQAILEQGCTATTGPTTAVPTTPPPTSPTEHKVELCHATSSHTNPYVLIEVDYHSVVKGGHGGHEGPVWQPGIAGKWGDIIPAFDLGGDAVYAGMNWSVEGQAFFAAGCTVPPPTTVPPTTEPPTTEPPTTVPEPTTTVPEPTTTVPEPPPTTEPTAHKVELCHATASHMNPYVKIEVDYHSVVQGGHGEHTGPIWHPGIEAAWGDIIPAFDLGGDAVYAGMNWSAEGQAFFAAGCTAPPPPTTTPETTPETTVPETVPPTTTPETTPETTVPETVPDTTLPESTTTVPEPTTTVPEETTSTTEPLGVQETTTTTGMVGSSVSTVVGPTVRDATEANPVTDPPAPVVPETTAPARVLGVSETRVAGELPITGAATELLLRLALILVVGGAVVLVQARRAT